MYAIRKRTWNQEVSMFIRVPDPPKTLSAEEQALLLEVIARKGSRRDLALFTLALGTGLRLREILGLNVGDVTTRSGGVVWKVELPKAITKGRRGGTAFLSERVRRVLADFLESKRACEEPLALKAPLFLSSQFRRLSLRQLQVSFKKWQEVAGFERPYNFHTLRHTAITNVYRATKDLFLTQRFARHANPITTVAYTHPSDEELYSAIAAL
jgi:site-specific recombinase XerC